MISEEEFISLYVQHETELRSFARSLTLQREDASDVVQDACIAMWRKIHTLESPRAFRRWAYSYVRLTALNQRRKKQASRLKFTGEMIEIMADEWEAEGELIESERQALTHCLQKLPDKQQKLLALYYTSSKTTAQEISMRLQKPVAGIYKALERTRTTLRECITRKLQTKKMPLTNNLMILINNSTTYSTACVRARLDPRTSGNWNRYSTPIQLFSNATGHE